MIRTVVIAAAMAARGWAGPLEFGKAELNAALEARGLNPTTLRIATEVNTDPAGSFQIKGGRIFGGDLRGLMYGLLEASEQIRANGRLSPVKGAPAMPIRGVRVFVHSDDVERGRTREYWLAYIQMLARNRFNRLNLVFAHQTNYMAPPYPFWISLEKFPEVKAAGLPPGEQRRNLEMLRYISETAADHGIDFTLGVWEHNVQNGMTPTVEGLTDENIGPYSYATLKTILTLCPAIRSVQMRTNSESGIPNDKQVEFYRDWVFRAIREANHHVTLDLRGWAMRPGLMEAAKSAGVPLRLSSKYWAEDLGRPYQPAETWPGYSFLNFLEREPGGGRPYQFYWELWGLGSHRLLLWGDPDYVRRAVPTFTMSDTEGFEIDPPLAQKGFGNTADFHLPTPGKWDFERYWMFYTLWGRLSYDPKASERVWMREMERRFGDAAGDVMTGYRSASKVLNEIVAIHLADPNMYIWPEINPGGLIESYRDVRPSDWRLIATIEEAVRNRMQGASSAKQTPLQTAGKLYAWARETDAALEHARKKIGGGNAEWKQTETELKVLSLLAQYHARKQTAADQLTEFYLSGHDTGLRASSLLLSSAQRIWREIVKLTDGIFPVGMSFAPDDKGHWKDKLPYIDHDINLVSERAAIYDKLGLFDWGFDFGAAPPALGGAAYRKDAYVAANTVQPRFALVTPTLVWDEVRGYGWLGDGRREARAIPFSMYHTVRAVAQKPPDLPANTLFGDGIRGSGAQVFRVTTGNGAFVVHFLAADGSVRDEKLSAREGVLDVVFPAGDWDVSGLVIKRIDGRHQLPVKWPEYVPRPAMDHVAPVSAVAGKPLHLALRVKGAQLIRLHYRPLNQLAKWKEMESAPGRFAIPAEDLSERWDLQYYFEILNGRGGGWFYPDPEVATPYYLVKVQRPELATNHP